MLKDRNKTKNIIKTLRWIAKQPDLRIIKWRDDKEFPLSFVLESTATTITLNSLYLYRQKPCP